jgi:hypothetical protein
MAIVDVGYNAAGAAYDYTTIAAGIAAANASDTVRVWYSTAKQNVRWDGAITLNKAIELTGGLSNRRIVLARTNTVITVSASSTISNFTFRNQSSSVYVNTASIDVVVCCCDIFGTGTAITSDTSASGTLLVRNCILSGGSSGIYLAAGTVTAINNTVVNSAYGFYRGGGTLAASNNVTYSCGTEYSGTVASGSNNASQDGTAPASGRVDLNAIDPKFVRDNLTGKYPNDFRIVVGSDLISAGVDVGLTTDIDSQSYSVGSFPIGCSSGLAYPNSLLTTAGGNWTKATAAYVLTGHNFGVSESEVAAYSPDFPAAANVLNDDTVNGSPGTFANVSVDDVRDGTKWGAAGTEYEGVLEVTTSVPFSVSGILRSAVTGASSRFGPEEALRQILLDSTGILGLVSSRICPESHADSITVGSTCITYTRTGTAHARHVGGATGIATATFEINAFSSSYDELNRLSEYIRLQLDTYSGTVTGDGGSLVVHSINVDDETDKNSGLWAGTDRPVFYETIRCELWHTETIPS